MLQQGLWTGSGGYCHLELDFNVSPQRRMSSSYKFAKCILPANFDTWEDRYNSIAEYTHRQRWEYFRHPTLLWVSRQGKWSSCNSELRHKESKEPFCVNKFYKLSFVDVLGQTKGPVSSTANSSLRSDSCPLMLLQWDVTAGTVRKLCDDGHLSKAVDALSILVRTEAHIPAALLYRVIKGCGAQNNLVLGRRVHNLSVKLGYESNTFLGNHILRMYACQGRLQEATAVFNRVATPNAFMWFSIISAHVKHGKAKQAIQLYHKMRRSVVKPDGHVFAAALQACTIAVDLASGRQLHADVAESGVPPDSFVGSCLVDMYAKCGKLEDARRVFDSLASKNVVAWNSMIAGYAEHGLGQEALALYENMKIEGLVLSNPFTFACLLKACVSAGAFRQGKQLHSRIRSLGLLDGDIVVGNSLVDMYVKCGKLEDARGVFDSLPARDVVTWTTMMAGYADHELGQEALGLYTRMEQEGMVLANGVTFACLLKACASAGALQQGKQLHSQIVERGLLKGDLVVGSCLVDMYAKCGKLADARRLFDSMTTKNVVTWTAMISGFGRNNEGRKAIACFEEMLQAGVQPNETTFTCLLAACSHEGLVNEGCQYFDAMVQQHGVLPTVKHYNCVVDLLGRAGHLDKAENTLSLFENNDVSLLTLLNACRSHRDIERGSRCFETIVRLDPGNASAYVLAANMYADVGRWADVNRIERLRRLAGASKKPAIAGIEVNRQVHTFVVGEDKDDISCKVRSMNTQLKEIGGHVPHTEVVLKRLSEREKEDELCGHAEKLALAYGLLNTPSGTPLLVTKNLRMCRDCHSSTEIVSRIERREIVVRDAYRVHRFEGGSCSCQGRP